MKTFEDLDEMIAYENYVGLSVKVAAAMFASHRDRLDAMGPIFTQAEAFAREAARRYPPAEYRPPEKTEPDEPESEPEK
jgi:hypothetical protein